MEEEDESSDPGPEEEDDCPDYPFAYAVPERDEDGHVLDVSCALPLGQKENARLEEIVHSLGTEAVKEVCVDVGEGNGDGLRTVRVVRERADAGYYMELDMDMSDYDRNASLVFCCGNMTEEQVMGVLWAICVEQRETDRIGLVWYHFRGKLGEQPRL